MKQAEQIWAKAYRAARRHEYRIIRFAGNLVEKAIRHSRLRRPTEFKCVDCGDDAQTYDHRFYSRPLEVEPVCRSCNKKRGHAWDLEMLSAECRT